MCIRWDAPEIPLKCEPMEHPATTQSPRRIGLLIITLIFAAVVWLVGGVVLYVMLKQQARIEADAQHIYDVSSAKVFEATRIIRGLERLAREGHALSWIGSTPERSSRRQSLQSLLDDGALQGDADMRSLLAESFAVLDANLQALARDGDSAQNASADKWIPVMQKILARSEAEGAQVSALAIEEADAILESTAKAQEMLLLVAAVIALASVAFFITLYLTLTRPLVKLTRSMSLAREGRPIVARKQLVSELQMLHDAAVSLSNTHLALNVARNQLEQLAHTDVLTGLANRRSCQTHGAQGIAYAQRYGTPLSLVVFDIDHFKNINDVYGHEGGDNALKSISRYFLDAVRGADQPVARMGGEEFALLLVRAPLAEAVLVAERMRLAIEKLEVAMPGNRTVQLTASLGVAQFRSDDADLNALMRRADQALYKAKERGRNRVEAAD
jgi:diguanylate cyclase (GGDEF)-like protein